MDGLIYVSSMAMLDSTRRKVPVPPLAGRLPGLGIAAPLAADVAYGLGHEPSGAVAAALPAAGLVGSSELLMVIIRSAYAPRGATNGPWAPDYALHGDPLQTRAAEAFTGEVAAGQVPSARGWRLVQTILPPEGLNRTLSLHAEHPTKVRKRDHCEKSGDCGGTPLSARRRGVRSISVIDVDGVGPCSYTVLCGLRDSTLQQEYQSCRIYRVASVHLNALEV